MKKGSENKILKQKEFCQELNRLGERGIETPW